MAETAALYGLTDWVSDVGYALAFPLEPRLFTLRDWVWQLDCDARARWVLINRPFVGFNPTLERVTNGR